MKNKTIILAAVLALPLCLTACDKNADSSGSSSSTTSSSVESSSVVSLSSSLAENSFGMTENSVPTAENDFPESFTGYLGETLYGANASEQFGRKVRFDNFTYLRWATPVFDNTLKTPDLINWDTYDMPKYDDVLTQNDPKWFLVKPGDVLENGLVVKSASCGFEEVVNYFDGREYVVQTDSEVIFENTLTLNGVLYCSPEDDAYIAEGDLFFFADTTVHSNVPVINRQGEADGYSLGKYIFSDAAFVCDGMYFRVGNIDSVSEKLNGIIERGGVSEVSVTLDDIRLGEYGDGRGVSGAYADIVSVDKLALGS